MSYTEAAEVLNAWLEGINGGDLERVASLYADDAVLIPTFSNPGSANPAERRSYFERLGQHRNLSVEVDDRTLMVQDLIADHHIVCGTYTWRFDVDGKPSVCEARFTFVVDLEQSHPIVHHHSSQVPLPVD